MNVATEAVAHATVARPAVRSVPSIQLSRRRFLASATVACPLTLSAMLTGCGPRASGDARRGLRIVTTTPMLGDMVRRIAPRIASEHLFGEGVDPHLYKPTRTDIVSLVHADVIVTNGLMLEGRMRDAFERAAESGRTVIPVGDELPADQLRHGEQFHGHPDPHIWMDPTLWAICGHTLARHLAERDPEGAEIRAALADDFERGAVALQRGAAAAIESVPAERRVLVTAHDAFGYFGRRFDIEVRAIQGISTESEAGLADLEELVSFIVEREIPAVFVESTVSPRTIQALIAGAKARNHEVRIGGQLFSDSMGPAGTPEGTWPGMIAHNVSTIVTALGGSVPREGLIPREFRHAID